MFDAVVHSGGTGIAYSALAAVLPSLRVPHDFDQFDMAARIPWYGLGLRAESLWDAATHLDRGATATGPRAALSGCRGGL